MRHKKKRNNDPGLLLIPTNILMILCSVSCCINFVATFKGFDLVSWK